MTPNPFESQALDAEQQNRVEIIRAEFKSLFSVFADYLQGSRYTSLAVTALEEAAMWAVKSISFEEVTKTQLQEAAAKLAEARIAEEARLASELAKNPEVNAQIEVALKQDCSSDECCGGCCKE